MSARLPSPHRTRPRPPSPLLLPYPPLPSLPSPSRLFLDQPYMGREVMSAYRRRKYTSSVSPPPTRTSSATNSSMESLADPAVNLTPQRKHHKLLKDGSEVWSKEVEKIFVEGLRQYWQSPWATYSRGRSRWRNQFLVDHLKRAGVERTKKQVASHIQVLRNMWRGTPGGEELFQENGLLAHTNNKKPTAAASETPSALTGDLPEMSAGSSSSSSTPEFSALDFPLELQTTTTFPTIPPTAHMSSFSDLALDDVLHTSVASLADPTFGTLSSSPQAAPLAPINVKLEPLAMDPALFTLPQGALVDAASAPDFQLSMPNRILNLHFWAEGMVPLSVDVDRLVGSTPSMPSRIFLHFKVSMPSIADLHCPPGLQGVSGAVSFASRWASLAKCHTKSWGPGRTVVSQDLGLFSQVTTPELQAGLNADAYSPQMVFAYLPDSALSRCHWLETDDYATGRRRQRGARRARLPHRTRSRRRSHGARDGAHRLPEVPLAARLCAATASARSAPARTPAAVRVAPRLAHLADVLVRLLERAGVSHIAHVPPERDPDGERRGHDAVSLSAPVWLSGPVTQAPFVVPPLFAFHPLPSVFLRNSPY
ncbi:hypothetical protein C8Q70DRAFT_18712 [Cubamyces menziesii]|nr:hypothetical protein C8Q70DRAFT_18712 [Cubamyces menziesii]